MKKFFFLSVLLFSAIFCVAAAKTDSPKVAEVSSAELAKDYYEFSKQNVVEAKKVVDDYFASSRSLTFWFAGIISLLAALISITSIWTKIEVQNKLKEQDNIISRLKETEAWSVNLRENAKIRLLYKEGTRNAAPIEKILNTKNFSKLKSQEVKEIIGSYSCEFVFINDEEGKFSGTDNDIMNKIINAMLEANEELFIFYFGKKVITPNENNALRITFANSYSQIYGNLMNLIKVRDIILFDGLKK